MAVCHGASGPNCAERNTIDNKLLPNVKNADLKSAINEIRPKVEAHLKEAQDIQKTLK